MHKENWGDFGFYIEASWCTYVEKNVQLLKTGDFVDGPVCLCPTSK